MTTHTTATLLVLAAIIGSSLSFPTGVPKGASRRAGGGGTVPECNEYVEDCAGDPACLATYCPSGDQGLPTAMSLPPVAYQEDCCGFHQTAGFLFVGNLYVDQFEEAQRMLETLNYGMAQVTPYTDLNLMIADMVQAGTSLKWVVFPEQQNGNYADGLSAQQVGDLRNFVMNGGVLLHALAASKESRYFPVANTFFSTLFGWPIMGPHPTSARSETFRVVSVSAENCMSSLPSSLPYLSVVRNQMVSDISALPDSTIYYSNGAGATNVWSAKVGSGVVFGLGYDYYNAVASSPAWSQVLLKSLAHGCCMTKVANINE